MLSELEFHLSWPFKVNSNGVVALPVHSFLAGSDINHRLPLITAGEFFIGDIIRPKFRTTHLHPNPGAIFLKL